MQLIVVIIVRVIFVRVLGLVVIIKLISFFNKCGKLDQWHHRVIRRLL